METSAANNMNERTKDDQQVNTESEGAINGEMQRTRNLCNICINNRLENCTCTLASAENIIYTPSDKVKYLYNVNSSNNIINCDSNNDYASTDYYNKYDELYHTRIAEPPRNTPPVLQNQSITTRDDIKQYPRRNSFIIADRVPQLQHGLTDDDGRCLRKTSNNSNDDTHDNHNGLSVVHTIFTKIGSLLRATVSLADGKQPSCAAVATEAAKNADIMTIISKTITGGSAMEVNNDTYIEDNQLCTDHGVGNGLPTSLTPKRLLAPCSNDTTTHQHDVRGYGSNSSQYINHNTNSNSGGGGSSGSGGNSSGNTSASSSAVQTATTLISGSATAATAAAAAHGNTGTVVTNNASVGCRVSPTGLPLGTTPSVPSNGIPTISSKLPLTTPTTTQTPTAQMPIRFGGVKGNSHVLVMVYGSRADCEKTTCGLRWVPRSQVKESWSTIAPPM